MMSSQAVDDLARRGTALAWRMYSEESWDGPAGQDAPPGPAAVAGGRRLPEGDPDQTAEPDTALSEFMGKVAQTRASRPSAGRTTPSGLLKAV